MRTAGLALGLAFAAAIQPALAGQVRTVRLRWADLPGAIDGRQVSIKTVAGTTRKGRVQAVENDAIVLENKKAPRVDRISIAEIRVTEYLGNGRRIGKLLGGTAGLLFGLAGAAAIGMREGSAHRTSDKVLAGTLGAGGLPLGLLGGYFLGRLTDKEVTVIQIIP